jgi:hypothetical protein
MSVYTSRGTFGNDDKPNKWFLPESDYKWKMEELSLFLLSLLNCA